MVKISVAGQNIEKRMEGKKERKTAYETSGTTLYTPTFTLYGVSEGEKRQNLKKYLKR